MKSILERYEGSMIVSVNTDQIMYLVPKHHGHTVQTQEGFGGLRNEIASDTVVQGVQHIGSRNCNVITKNINTGLVTQSPKVCGLSLQQEMTSGKIDSSTFANILRNQNEKLTMLHSKSRKKTPKDTLEPAQKEVTTYTISAKHVDSNRYSDPNTLYIETFAYGEKH